MPLSTRARRSGKASRPSARPRAALVALVLVGAGCGLPPAAIRGEVATQAGVAGVPCAVNVWVGKILPLDGEGSPVATTEVTSGVPFEAVLEWIDDPPSASLYWVSFECRGHHVKLRAFEWSALDVWRPVVDVGRVWVPTLASPKPPRAGR